MARILPNSAITPPLSVNHQSQPEATIIPERDRSTPPSMTDPPIEDLSLTDTEYAQLLTQGYDPELERQLIVIGEDPTIARKMTRFFGRLLGKSPETESDWEELIDDWDNIWGID